MNYSIKVKFYFSFLFLSLLSVLLVLISYIYNSEQNKIDDLTNHISTTQLLALQNSKNISDFIQNDSRNNDFFESGKSRLIESIDSVYHLILYKNKQATTTLASTFEKLNLKQKYAELLDEIASQKKNYLNLKVLVRKRGFTEYGYIGEMRQNIHEVEQAFPNFRAQILSIRRNEKDYLLRLDSTYITKTYKEIHELRALINSSKNEYSIFLDKYKASFESIIKINNRIGINVNQGLYNELSKNDLRINESAEKLVKLLRVNKLINESKLQLITFFITSFLVVFSVGLAVYFSNRFSNPILKLAKNTHQYVKNEFLIIEKMDIKTSDVEMKSLIENYQKMQIEMSKLIHKFNEEVADRTKTISEQNNTLKELNATKDRFFSIIAHDLKSPFVSMIEFSSKLFDNYKKYDDDKKIKYIGNIKTISSSTFKLLENLLEWARIQSGQIRVNKNLEDLKKLIKEVLSVSETVAEIKQIKIINEIPSNLIVDVDKEITKTVVRNLVSNAIKFTPNNGLITISSNLVNDNYIISIKDNGVGIPKNRIQDLFRVDKNTSTNGTNQEKGTGLGLVLCKELIEKQGGEISIESEVGQGTIINFSIPSTATEISVKNSDFISSQSTL